MAISKKNEYSDEIEEISEDEFNMAASEQKSGISKVELLALAVIGFLVIQKLMKKQTQNLSGEMYGLR